MPSFKLPEFYSPFPVRINPHREAVEARIHAWIVSIGLAGSEAALQRITKSDFGGLVARTYLHASADDLFVIYVFNLFLFTFDDQFDDTRLGTDTAATREAMKKFRDFMQRQREGNPTPANIIEKVWQYYWVRVRELTSPAWQARFLDHMERFLLAVQWQTEVRLRDEFPDFITYIDERRDNGAVKPDLDLIELANRAEVPESFHHSRLGQILELVAVDAIDLVNDIFSYEKEIARGDLTNGVAVYQRLTKGSVQQAVDQLDEVITARTKLFQQAKQAIPAFLEEAGYSAQERKAIGLYIGSLEDWIGGSLAWSRTSLRYQETEHARPGQPVSWIQNLLDVDETSLVAPDA